MAIIFCDKCGRPEGHIPPLPDVVLECSCDSKPNIKRPLKPERYQKGWYYKGFYYDLYSTAAFVYLQDLEVYCNVLEEKMNRKKVDETPVKRFIKVTLEINPETGEMYAIGGDREPCMHGHPSCCDTKYIGYEWIKEKIKKDKQ